MQAGEELNKRIEASRSATASSKANASAAVMNKLASFGGTELVETDLTAVAAALAVYSDYLEVCCIITAP